MAKTLAFLIGVFSAAAVDSGAPLGCALLMWR
jgi:hypothetical protein